MGGGPKPKSTKYENESTSPQWIDLPVILTANILRRLGGVEILESAQKVCSSWRWVCQDPAMWRVIRIKRNAAVCRRLVDLSMGQLADLTIHKVCDDDLLNYTLHRSTHLKRLTLQHCHMLTPNGLVKAVQKLGGHLEELHLTIMPDVKAEDIIKMGISCPILKSFTFNRYGFSYPSTKYFFEEPHENDYAIAIANSMPNLCHLRLIAIPINNDGVQLILDACPKLESLDLRQCLDVDLQGPLGKRCLEQIKHLKFPLDSVSYEELFKEPPFYEDDFCDDFSDYDHCGATYDYEDDDYGTNL